MKSTFLITQQKLAELNWLKFTDRDKGQLEAYEGKPAVLFPCALISVSMPKRNNLTKVKQMRTVSITIRLGFEKLYDSSSLNNETNRLKAVDYYDKIEEVDELLQGFANGHFASAWQCTATVDEQRPDFDIVRFTFTSTIVK